MDLPLAALDGAALQEWLYRPEIMGLVPQGGSWLQGGCWILAEALRRVFEGELWMIVEADDPTPQHVVCRVGRRYLDGDGSSDARELLRRWEDEEMLHRPRLQPLSEERVRGIPYDEAAVCKLVELIEAELH
jgi:hypothetical protein